MNDPLDSPPQFEKDDTPLPARHSVKRSASRSRFKKSVIFLGASIIVVGLGFEAFKVFTKKNKPSPVKEVSVQQTVKSQQSLPKDVPDAGTMKSYSNTTLGLKLSYPDTWKVSETADQGLRIESPEFSLISNEEGTVPGLFRVYIRKGARASDSKYIGRGYAVAASEKLAYTNPGNDQRKDTLITKFGLDEPTNFAYFFIAGNFQLSKGDTLGPDYGKEAGTFIIAGGYTSAKNADDLAMYTVSTDMPSTSNAYKQAVGIIASLQLD